MSEEQEDGYDDDIVERIFRADRQCEKSPNMTHEELLAELGLNELST